MKIFERELAARDAYGLSDLEAAMYVALIERLGRTVSHEYLSYRMYWRYDVMPLTIRSTKKRLVRRLPDDQVIIATYGAGYRLTVPEGWQPPWA
ncbi:MAG TPA: hypothetical protein DIT40_08835 [Alphaproteobacteria bacterium]|nr:hypothetical protein [Alphaproteobacteria bacterium]